MYETAAPALEDEHPSIPGLNHDVHTRLGCALQGVENIAAFRTRTRSRVWNVVGEGWWVPLRTLADSAGCLCAELRGGSQSRWHNAASIALHAPSGSRLHA
jgi:hypothetical protein